MYHPFNQTFLFMKKIATVLLAAFILLNACMDGNGHRVKGDGSMTSKTFEPGGFNGVELSSGFDVYLTQGSKTDVKIEAEQNILSYIDVRVENGVLNIDSKEHVWLDPTQTVKVYITSPSYKSIDNSGSGHVTAQTKITHDGKFNVSSSGSGEMSLDLDAPEIEAHVSGSGTVSLSGETKKISADVSGSGGVSALNLKSEECDLGISGSGNIDVYSSIKLDANISGSGKVRYKGTAQVSKNISGSGEVTKID